MFRPPNEHFQSLRLYDASRNFQSVLLRTSPSQMLINLVVGEQTDHKDKVSFVQSMTSSHVYQVFDPKTLCEIMSSGAKSIKTVANSAVAIESGHKDDTENETASKSPATHSPVANSPVANNTVALSTNMGTATNTNLSMASFTKCNDVPAESKSKESLAESKPNKVETITSAIYYHYEPSHDLSAFVELPYSTTKANINPLFIGLHVPVGELQPVQKRRAAGRIPRIFWPAESFIDVPKFISEFKNVNVLELIVSAALFAYLC